MKSSVYKPTLTKEHLLQITALQKTGLLDEKQQKKIQVLTMTHAGEKRESISEKIGINMDTITEWKKVFVKEGMEVYLGLKKNIATAKKTASTITKKITKTVKNLEQKVEQKIPRGVSTAKKTTVSPTLSPTPLSKNISDLESYIVNVLTQSYESVALAIQTYSTTHGTDTKKKIIKTYKTELKKAQALIKTWTKKVEDLKYQLKKQTKTEEKKKNKKKKN